MQKDAVRAGGSGTRGDVHLSHDRAPKALLQPHVKEAMMPYNSVADLPKAQTDQYNPHQKEAFLKAFNSAYKEYGGDEGRAFAVAHTAAKRAGEKSGPG
jgi:cation transport regulator